MILRHFLHVYDFNSETLRHLLNQALALKKNPIQPLLAGKSLGLIFEKPSTRTRVSFEVGMTQLGGSVISLQNTEIGLNSREPVKDISRVLSRYVDMVMIRAYHHRDVLEFAAYATVPIINGLSDLHHPCQGLADALTILEKKGTLQGIKLCYIGDGNNVCRSLLEIGTRLGMNVVVCCPQGYEPDMTGVSATISHAPAHAVKDADVIYTDVWTSMGQENEFAKRMADFEGFAVTADLVAKAKPDAIVMHCLPAHRDQEITDEVMESPQSVVFDQAENRMHAQKSLMLHVMGVSL
jgi:ornithine carbamoyltransferase